MGARILAIQPSSSLSAGWCRSLRARLGGFQLGFGLLLVGAALRAAPGAVDTGFNPGAGANGDVLALAVQPDGKILVGGDFTSLAGTSRNHIARINTDGSLDASFDPNANDEVLSVVVQADGKILIAGDFTSVAGIPRNHIARLHTDGTVDTNFAPNVGAEIICMVMQADGRLLIGGAFANVGDTARRGVARLNADGSLDTSFGPSANDSVISMAVQSNGQILLGGAFTSVDGATRNHIARLHSSGTLDTGFDPQANDLVYSLAVQPDEKILIGGRFTFVDGARRDDFARLNADGTLDRSFRNTSVDSVVHSIVLQAEGKILIGGQFALVGGLRRSRIARLGADGTVDTGFDPNANGTVLGVALQADGNILLGGRFTTLGDAPRTRIARLANEPATQTLRATSVTRLEWLRGVTTPEVSTVTFEISRDGGRMWTVLGNGARIPGGWALAGVVLPASGSLRARGRTAGGAFNGSSGLVEQVQPFAQPPPAAPVVIAPTNANVTTTAATLGGDVSFDGNAAITERGVVYAITTANADPQIGGFGVTKVSATGTTGVFAMTIAGLAEGTNYSYAIYATNSIGTTYTNAATFTTQPASTNANLSSLTLSVGALEPTFTKTRTSYRASVTSATSSIVIAPTPVDPKATVTVNGSTVAAGQSSNAIPLVEGVNTITVHVTSRDGTTTQSYAIVLTRMTAVPGEVDTDFGTSVNDIVYSMAVQGDGKVVLGGRFTAVSGRPRNRIARLNADGTVDASFAPEVSGQVVGLAVQADGRILLGSGIMSVDGTTRNGIARLNTDGTLDRNFDPNVSGAVYGLATQSDGKILCGGSFTAVGGTPRNRAARINPNGTLDYEFAPNVAGNARVEVLGLTVQLDGKILLWGWFTSVNGILRNNIARLNPDGTVDTAFNPNVDSGVYGATVQPDGKILLGGYFSEIGGTPRGHIARLHSDGTLDRVFDPNANGEVISLAVQADGRILLGGGFTAVGGIRRDCIARINTDGSVDNSFVPNTDPVVVLYSLAMQPDGNILVGANTYTDGIASRNYLLRLTNGPASQVLKATSRTRVEWLRSGTAPELSGVTFEVSTDEGATWSAVGRGVRIQDGWELAGLALPTRGLLRARGRTTSGYANDSSGLLQQESVFSKPVISSPSSAGITITTATLGAEVTFDGNTAVTERGLVYAATTINHDPRIGGPGVTQVRASEVGSVFTAKLVGLKPDTNYSFAGYATNAFGTTYTDVATLTTQPAGYAAFIGSSVSLMAATVGNGPFTFGWRWNGTILPDKNGASLTISDVQPRDAGIYSVDVSDGGPATNSVAMLGLRTREKVVGEGAELRPADIPHPNGHIFDQVLLTGVAETITADAGQVTRTSFVDLDDDIVQVEFSGAGSLSLALANPTGPALPVSYNQPTVSYMKGHAGIVIVGADETTNVGIFSVGRATANDNTGNYNILQPPTTPGAGGANDPTTNGSPLFVGRERTHYDGIADIAFIAILSTDGKFGGVRTANANYFAHRGLTGLYAPGVEFTGPVFIGNITAFDEATPVLRLGSVVEARITGGDLFQDNSAPVQVSGLRKLQFTAGSDSGGRVLDAQANQGRLEQDGVDVTAEIVVNPMPQ